MSVPVRDLSGARWRRSTYSGASGNQCVEMADLGDTIAIRDSKNPGGPVLLLDPCAFDALLGAVYETT